MVQHPNNLDLLLWNFLVHYLCLLRRYRQIGVPLVIHHQLEGCSALTKWTNDYLKDHLFNAPNGYGQSLQKRVGAASIEELTRNSSSQAVKAEAIPEELQQDIDPKMFMLSEKLLPSFGLCIL
jgi:hypothetical protein